MKVRLETEAKLYLQGRVRSGALDLAWSYILDFEISESPFEDKKRAILPWKEIAKVYCPSSDDVLKLGRDIMYLGVKPKDALHLACAIKMNCDYFITTDSGLTNKNIPDIRIANPIDFVRTEN
jgi:predicted nucleic acid-binding protein